MLKGIINGDDVISADLARARSRLLHDIAPFAVLGGASAARALGRLADQ
jgi:hypothetical protein